MTVHNYRSRQVHETLNEVNPSSGFRDVWSAKSGPNLWQIWQVFGPWASPYGANGQMSMTVHSYRPRQFHRTSNGENPSSGYRDMGSASLAAARPTARPPASPPARPPARTVTTIPLQPGGLRGKNQLNLKRKYIHFFQCFKKNDLVTLNKNISLTMTALQGSAWNRAHSGFVRTLHLTYIRMLGWELCDVQHRTMIYGKNNTSYWWLSTRLLTPLLMHWSYHSTALSHHI